MSNVELNVGAKRKRRRLPSLVDSERENFFRHQAMERKRRCRANRSESEQAASRNANANRMRTSRAMLSKTADGPLLSVADREFVGTARRTISGGSNNATKFKSRRRIV